MRMVLKTAMFVYQSKPNLDVKVVFGKITHHFRPIVRKMLLKSSMGTRMSSSTLVDDLPAVEIKFNTVVCLCVCLGLFQK